MEEKIMTGIFDRKEGKKAMIELENGDFQAVCLWKISPSVQEGDVLIYNVQTDCWEIDIKETQLRREKIRKKVENFWNRE